MAKGLARSKMGLPITLVGTCEKHKAHHTLLTATHAVQRMASFSIVAASLPVPPPSQPDALLLPALHSPLCPACAKILFHIP